MHNQKRVQTTLSNSNRALNQPTGDSLDPFIYTSQHASSSTEFLRIYFQNINGFRLEQAAIDIKDAFMQMRAIGADVFGFAEINVDVDQYQVNEYI